MLTDFILQEMGRQALNTQAQPLSLYRRLYLTLKMVIQSQALRAGERLPSSRDLAKGLSLARNTVLAALSQLEAEGFLETRTGSGTYVRKQVGNLKARNTARSQVEPQILPAALSSRATLLLSQPAADELEVQPFTQGLPDFSPFPLKLWQKLQNKHWRLSYANMLDYNATGGFLPLKRALAQYLSMFRGISLQADQILITTGTQQSLSLCATLLSDPGDTVWVEDPLYWGAAQIFRASGLHMHGLPTDEQGLNTQACLQAPVPRMAYVTPAHHYPTGGTLSLERRHALLEHVRSHQAWVLEDDYDSEFRFSGPVVSALKSLDVHERVFYVGTFSKTLYPDIKMAYLVVPPEWITAFKRAHYDLHRPGQVHQQVAMAEFIELGHFHDTVRIARQHHNERRQALLQTLAPCLSNQVMINGAEQGLHLCLNLPDDVNDMALALQAAQQGLCVRPLSNYTVARKNMKGLVVGYGYAPLKGIFQDGQTLANLINRTMERRRPSTF
jgi:GntR family transcriptional regulator/MocR family aminotransferase